MQSLIHACIDTYHPTGIKHAVTGPQNRYFFYWLMSKPTVIPTREKKNY